MIVEEIMQDEQLVRHYSDANKYIKQVETDRVYVEAIDIMPCVYNYEETEEEIVEETEDTEDVENIEEIEEVEDIEDIKETIRARKERRRNTEEIEVE